MEILCKSSETLTPRTLARLESKFNALTIAGPYHYSRAPVLNVMLHFPLTG